jgi:hypothetical protein
LDIWIGWRAGDNQLHELGAHVKRWTWSYTLEYAHAVGAIQLFHSFLFSGGMTLSGLFSAWPSSWWQLIAWSVLTALFGVQAVLFIRAGRRAGWDAPIEGKRNHE